MSIHRLIQFAAACVVFAGAYLVISSADPADASQQPEVVPTEVKNESPPPAPVELKGEKAPETAKPDPVDTSNQLLLPDGTTVPVLNGAFGAPALGWPKDRPWSPIIRKETDKQGDEWYVHEDGSYTITQNLYHSHLKGMAPVTNVFNPTKSLPMDPDELRLVTGREARQARKKAKAGKKGARQKK
jgi:hypothetical protein